MESSDDFDQTQAVVLEDFNEDDLTDELDSNEEKKPAAFIRVLFQKGLAENTYPVYGGDNIVGRHANTCHVYIPSKSLSKEHACIQIVDGSHLISDKSSRNKTRRGKLLLRPEAWYELKHGDEITFADVKCIYEMSKQISETVAETDSESETSQSLLLHHDVTEEHSFDVTRSEAIAKETKLQSFERGNISVPETQDFSKLDNEEKQNKNSEVVHETVLLDESGSETSDDHFMFAAATQAYIVEDEDKSTDSTEAATQAYTSAWENVEEVDEALRNEPTQPFLQLLKERNISPISDHKTLSLRTETQSCKSEVKSIKQGNQSIEEATKSNIQQIDSGDTIMLPTQVFNEDTDDSKDAAELFAASTVAYDEADNSDEGGNLDANGFIRVMDLEAPLQNSVTQPFDTNCGVNAVLKEPMKRESFHTTRAVVSSSDIPSQILESLVQTADETPFAETSANISEHSQCGPEGIENMSTQIFDETVSSDTANVSSSNVDPCSENLRQVCHPDINKNNSSVESSMTTNCLSARDVEKDSPKIDNNQFVPTFNGPNVQMLIITDSKENEVAQNIKQRKKINQSNKDNEDKSLSDDDNESCENICIMKTKSDELTQEYGIAEGNDTETFRADSSNEVAALSLKEQICGPKDLDATQLFMENEECIEDDDKGLIQIFGEKNISPNFDKSRESCGAASDIAAMKISDTLEGCFIAHLPSDDDSDLEDESVLKCIQKPFDDPIHFEYDSAVNNIEVMPNAPKQDDKISQKGSFISTCINEETDVFMDTEEIVPDSMADNTDEKSSMISLPFTSHLKAVHLDNIRSTSPTHEQLETAEKDLKKVIEIDDFQQSAEDDDKNITVKSRRTTRRQAISEKDDLQQSTAKDDNDTSMKSVRSTKRSGKAVKDDLKKTPGNGNLHQSTEKKDDKDTTVKSRSTRRSARPEKDCKDLAIRSRRSTKILAEPENDNLQQSAEKSDIQQPTEIDNLQQPTEKDHLQQPTEIDNLQLSTEKDDLQQPTERDDLQHPTEEDDLQHSTEKGDLQHPAEKGNLQHPTEKGHLQHPTEKDDLQHPAEKDDLQHPAEKGNLQHPTEKDDLQHSTEDDDLQHSTEKGDLQHPAEKGNLQHPTEKDDLQHSTEKGDLQHPAEKDDLQHSTEKGDLQHPAEKDDLQHPTEKDDLQYPTEKDYLQHPTKNDDLKESTEKDDLQQLIEIEDKDSTIKSGSSNRRPAAPIYEESKKLNSSSSRLQKTRNKKVTSQAMLKNNTELVIEIYAEDKSETKPLSESMEDHKVADVLKDEVDFNLVEHEVELKSVLDNQNKVSEILETSKNKENVIAVPNIKVTLVQETSVLKARTRGRNNLITNPPEAIASKSENVGDEISQSATKHTRSVKLKKQVLDLAYTDDNLIEIKNPLPDILDICNSNNDNNGTVAHLVEKEATDCEIEESGFIASSANDDSNLDMEKKEDICVKRLGRRKTIEKLKKEDTNKSGIDINDSIGPRVSSRGRHISANPYLKDFETDRKTKKQRSSLLPDGEDRFTEKESTSKVSNKIYFGNRNRQSDNEKPTGEESKSHVVEPSYSKKGKSKQIMKNNISNIDDKHTETKTASNSVETQQDILNNVEFNQEKITKEKPVRATRARRKCAQHEEIGNPQLTRSPQSHIRDKDHNSEPPVKTRNSLKNKVSTSPVSNKNSKKQSSFSSVQKLKGQCRNLQDLEMSSTESLLQPTTCNIKLPEPQILLTPADESQPLTATVQSKARGRGRKSGSTRASRDNEKVGDRSSSETRTAKRAGAHIQVPESPAKKSKKMTFPQTPEGKTEVYNIDTQSPSLRKSSTGHKPRVMFTGLIDEQGEKIVKDLGGELASTIQECSHLVTDKVRRTVKFLSGLAKGLLIVSPRWLESCKQAGTFIDGRMFLVSDPTIEKQYKFNLATSISKAQRSPMLTGYSVHVSTSVRPDPVQMQDVLTCAGADYLTTMPSKPHDKIIVVSCKEDHKLCLPAIKAGIPIMEVEFILTGILRQELDFKSTCIEIFDVTSMTKGKLTDDG